MPTYASSPQKGGPEIELTDLYTDFMDLVTDRAPYEADWKNIHKFLLPSKGLFQLLTRPLKRSGISKVIINPVAQEALDICAAGLYEMFTSPSKAWFYFKWKEEEFNSDDFLMRWMQDSSKIIREQLLESNFYQNIYQCWQEEAGFGTTSLYTGEDSADGTLYRFETQTIGEYVFNVDSRGLLDKYYRIHFFTPRQLIQEFGKDKVPDYIVQQNSQRGHETTYYTVLQCCWYREILGKPITSVTFLVNSANSQRSTSGTTDSQLSELRRSGYYEFPYHVARWDVTGSQLYGIGPGHRTLPNNQRIQEIDKAFLIGTHKNVNPPTIAPSRMRGELSTLPGARNWSMTPADKVESIYNVNMDYSGVLNASDSIERHIRTGFYNDVFITGSRDPNASPLRTGQVNAMEDEKLMRLSPMVGRNIHELLNPMLQRAFAIGLRKGALPDMPDRYRRLVGQGDYNITYVSPLAQAQQIRDSRRLQAFVSFAGGVAGVVPTVLDKIDADSILEEYAEMTNTSQKVFRPDSQVSKIREDRKQAEAQAQKQQQDLAMRQFQNDENLAQSEVLRNTSEAGINASDVLGGLTP